MKPTNVANWSKGNMDRMKVIIQSCTPEERKEPTLIRKTRIARIARGSGTTYTEVKGMLKNWKQMKVMIKKAFIKQTRERGQRRQRSGIPGMDGLPGNMDINQIQQIIGHPRKKRKKHPW